MLRFVTQPRDGAAVHLTVILFLRVLKTLSGCRTERSSVVRQKRVFLAFYIGIVLALESYTNLLGGFL